MRDDDERSAHPLCMRWKNQGLTYAAIVQRVTAEARPSTDQEPGR